jgi:hypothetical protein
MANRLAAYSVVGVFTLGLGSVAAAFAEPEPRSIAITREGSFAYVTTSDPLGGIAIVATATNTIVDPGGNTSIATIGGIDIVTHPSGVSYVSLEAPGGGGELAIIDTATHTTIPVPCRADPTRTCLGIEEPPLASGTGSLVCGFDRLAVGPDGRFVYATNRRHVPGCTRIHVIDTAAREVVRTIQLDDAEMAVLSLAVTPDGRFLYAGTAGGAVLVISTARNRIVGRIPLPPSAAAHRADFLTNPDCDSGTIFYATADPAARTRCRNGVKSRGYTHLYISVASSRHDFFDNAPGFARLLRELVNDGIKPVVWLTSDTGGWKDQSMAKIKADLASFIPQIDSLVSSYSLGVEVDEFWTKSEADQIGNHLRTLTAKPIAAHQTTGRWDYCRSTWCSYMVLQYGFGQTESVVARMTRQAIADLGKPVVAGEYNEGPSELVSVRLGDAAVAAGAVGFGNGGTP